jgi:D-alanyl-D-alanine dipeptidase
MDAWRTPQLQKYIYASAREHGQDAYVAEPTLKPIPSPHITGGAVDLTLTWNGFPLSLGTAYDCLNEYAHAESFESQDGIVRDLRRLLYWTLRMHGFVINEREWWHFEYGTGRWAQLCHHATPLYAATNPPEPGDLLSPSEVDRDRNPEYDSYT